MTIRCHYDVLGVPRDADDATIKRAHRTMALRYHPDKNLNDPDAAAEQFRLVQQAYECLSDASERRYYDDHRDAILQGWSASNARGGGEEDEYEFFVDLVHYMHPSCYQGFDDGPQGFFAVYRNLFQTLSEKEGNNQLPDFGDSTSDWGSVSQFYASWLAFSSELSFAWADVYDTSRDGDADGEHRRVKRAMADANAKARKAARKSRNDDVRSLVKFVQRRDVRVKARQLHVERQRQEQEHRKREEAQLKKHQARIARKEWREQAEQEQAAAEEEDRLAGRVRLADLDDDYDYGGGKKKKGKKKGKKKQVVVESSSSEEDDDDDDELENGDDVVEGMKELSVKDDSKDENDAPSQGSGSHCRDPDRGTTASTVSETNNTRSLDADDDENGNDDDDESESSSEEDEPDVWRCECCRKDFKSRGQMENHFSSKKHKQAFKSYQAKQQTMAQHQAKEEEEEDDDSS
jgi:DnaJ homolog subfamily A member 5